MRITFEEWAELTETLIMNSGYTGPIDRGSLFDDYDIHGMSPEESAKAFIKEMND